MLTYQKQAYGALRTDREENRGKTAQVICELKLVIWNN